MADNILVTPGSGASVATDDVGGAQYQRIKLNWGPDGTANEADVASGKPLPAQVRHSDGTIMTDTTGLKLSSTAVASVLDCSTTVTLPGTGTAHSIGDALANSTSAPTTGGFTLTNAAAASGGGGIITDAVIVSSNPSGTTLTGEIWLFDGAVTAINDDAAFALSDSDALLYLGKIPFALAVDATNNGIAHVTGLNIGYHCVGSANLRYLMKTLIAYTPANSETITVRIKGVRA